MRASLLLLPLLLILSACQTPQLQRDFDPSRDFAAYRSWSWQEPGVQYRPDDPRLASDLTAQRIRDAVSEQLDQRGLRAAPANTPGDLKVQVWLIVDNRQQQVSTQMGGGWGGSWHAGYWAGPSYVETRTLAGRPVRRQRWQAGLARQRRTGAAQQATRPGRARSLHPPHRGRGVKPVSTALTYRLDKDAA
jgi:hypothetical protein